MGIGNLIKDYFYDMFSKMTRDMPSLGDRLISRINFEIRRTERRIMKNLAALFILLLSFAMLAFSAIFFLIEYIHLTNTLSFLAIGIILLLIGIIIRVTK